jgi:hypothetical protein
LVILLVGTPQAGKGLAHHLMVDPALHLWHEQQREAS